MGKLKSYSLVAGQFACIGYLLLSGPTLLGWSLGGLVQLTGVVVGLWAVAAMRISNLNIAPHVREDSRLVRRGPYRRIRHPMYLSVLLAFLPPAFIFPHPWRWLAKLLYEEHLLKQRFSEYLPYQSQSWRLIPFLF